MKTYLIAMMASLSVFIWTNVAHAVETDIVDTYGDWTLSVNIHDDDSLSCSIRSRNAYATFSVIVSQDGIYSIYGLVPDITAEHEAVTFKILLDQEVWNISSADTSNSIHGLFWHTDIHEDSAMDFLDDMANASVLLLDPDTSNISFSLNGTAKALMEMEKCRQLIVKKRR
jgi:hypothetical protein